jgi:DNA (cytosine-5)-methyltransferase 1
MGYHRAGFDVVGVDIKPQPRYPFKFVQADALEFIAANGHEFDVIHASPPCQAYSATAPLSNGNHPRLIEATRAALIATGKPYVIENVPGAPLLNPIILNGAMFGMLIHRNRLFELSFDIPFFLIPPAGKPVKMGRQIKRGDIIQPVGNFSGVEYAKEQMGIDWMTQTELAQAIPPAYTKWLGEQMLIILNVIPTDD